MVVVDCHLYATAAALQHVQIPRGGSGTDTGAAIPDNGCEVPWPKRGYRYPVGSRDCGETWFLLFFLFGLAVSLSSSPVVGLTSLCDYPPPKK